jgi:sugar/nucleoside kinase (ribokinase family)
MRFRFPKNRMFDVVGIGRNSWDRIGLVDAYPPINTKAEIRVMDQQAGGQAATTLVTAVRLGASARYLGKFGDDAAGRAVRGALAKEGVDLSESKVIPDVPNQASFVVVDAQRKTRNIFTHTDPRLRLSPDDFSFEAVTSGKILFLGGRNPADMLQFARNGRDAGCVIVLDADSAAEGAADLLQAADVVICPEPFPTEFTGERSLERAMQDLGQMGPRIVCCTLGASGAVALAAGEFLRYPAPDVDVVDTTGAGDVFQGAFLAGLLDGLPLPKLMELASAAAALKCRTIGGQRGIPNRQEIAKFLTDRRT